MLSYRRFDKESDYNIMRHIVQHNCKKSGHLYPQLHIGNLDFERYSFGEILNDTTWFVLDGIVEIGFITRQEDEFFFAIIPEYKHLIQDILKFIECNCYVHGATITTEANSKDRLICDALEERGYIKTSNFRFNGICDLSKIASYPPLLGEFKIRQTQMKDVARRVELFGLAAGGATTTPERYIKMMNSPSYCDAMDLVVLTGDEEIIAYCTIWNDPVSKIAILEPVACVKEYRRKGIMKSTLLYGMNLLKDSGTKYMYVSTSGPNIASQALYKSVGFVEHGVNCEWQKKL
ncbi:hypothetical protein AN1V17_50750 [Vallitalea sediminicola]